VPYLAMRYLSGGTLSDQLYRSASAIMPETEIVQIVTHIAGALDMHISTTCCMAISGLATFI